jgi:hypothetical protein
MSEYEVREPLKRRLKWPFSRQRLIEMTVVIFGVLIALGLENLVQEVRLRGDARELEAAFREDILSAVRLSVERETISPCLAQRLVFLADRVITPGGTMDAAPAVRFPGASMDFALPQPYRAPKRTWRTFSFDRALGSEAFKRIPASRARAYGQIFAQIKSMNEANAAEYLAIGGIGPLAYPQPEMNVEVRTEMLQDITQLDRYQILARVVAGQIIEGAITMHGAEGLRTEIRSDRAGFVERALKRKAEYGSCVDLGATDRLIASVES